MKELAGFVAFAFVGTVSPGPNNAVLWASGLNFGFRRTWPHVLGTTIGMGALTIAIAAGIGAFLEAVPAAETVLKIAGSLYLLYIAYLVLQGGSVTRREVASPLTVWQGIWFQFLNPKAWVFIVAAVATFLPEGSSRVLAIAGLTGVLMVVVVGTASIWAAGGVALGQVLDDERSRRGVSITLAVLLAASVALIWM
jgi:threonine/homoserine/homoserine lactone efflux protein